LIFVELVLAGLMLGGVYALISIGLTLIFGVLRVVNFAHGEMLMLGMFAAYWASALGGLPPYVTAVVALPLFAVFGWLVYRLVVRRTLGMGDVVQIFATVGVGVVLQNAALVLWTGDFRTIRSGYADAVLRVGGVQVSVPLLVAFAVAIGVSGLLFLFLDRTLEGRAVRAVAQDPISALALAIDTDRVYMRTFVLGVCCVGLAGVLLAPSYPIFPAIGLSFGLVSYVVVVLGGLGSMAGALLGGFIIGLIEVLSGYFLGTALKQAIYFLIFVLVLLVRPQGLFGQRGAETMGFGKIA
jgi:branched-chain amino acid transport system permease protein